MKISSVKPVNCVLWNDEQSAVAASAQIRSPTWLKAIVSAVISRLLYPSDPVIRYEKANKGEIWRVYDPQTQQETDFFSENEVRVWIENRYYQ